MTKDERIEQLSSRVMELEEQLRLAQIRAADAADAAHNNLRRAFNAERNLEVQKARAEDWKQAALEEHRARG